MNRSIWETNVEMPAFPKLEGDGKTDVLIVGGGICGILCAYFMHWAGVDYLLTEAGRIGQGITQRSGAKLTVQHGLIYKKMIQSAGLENAQRYLKANENALERYTQMCKGIDCDFERKTAYTYSYADRQKIEDEVRAVNTLGGSADFVEKLRLPFTAAGAIKMRRQASFNPLKFIAGIAKGLNIYENTKMIKLGQHRALSACGTVAARKVIITTHTPFNSKYGSYFARLYPYRSYQIGLEDGIKLDGMYMDEAQDGISFSHHKDLLLIGGGGHKSGKKGGGWEKLRSIAKSYFPESKERYAWAAQDCMSLDGLPYIGHYSSRTPDLYVATGFNQWGMTTAMAAALILRDMVLERENEFEPVFTPQRSLMTPRFFVNGFDALFHLRKPTRGGKSLE